jgi:hypothetical protein
MTNNKQQTEINAVEYLDKINQFAKENSTDKPKQQTAIEWFSQQVLDNWNDIDAGARDIIEFFNQAKEMEAIGKEMSYDDGYAEGYKRALDYMTMSIKNAIETK